MTANPWCVPLALGVMLAMGAGLGAFTASRAGAPDAGAGTPDVGAGAPDAGATLAWPLLAQATPVARDEGVQPSDSTGAREDSTTAAVVTPDLVVTARGGGRSVGVGDVRLGDFALEIQDGRAIADLGPLLPSTRAAVNSRGETLFMVRGAPERHVRVFLEGIPLTVPWDERADLSMVPTDAIGEVHAQRGVHSVLDGPNALAGVVQLRPAERLIDGQRTLVTALVGEAEHVEAHVTHTRKSGPWDLLAAAARRDREGWVLPADLHPPFNQPDRRLRVGSDLEQSAFTLRLARSGRRGRHIALLLMGMQGSKGVPPETHLADARFWRYPEHSRGLVGLTAEMPLDASRLWDLRISAAADFFHQEIRQFDDITYTSPALVPGADYETNDDRSGYAQLQLTRSLGQSTRVTAKAVARYSRHVESLTYEGPEEQYAQFLGSWVGEISHALPGGWRVTAGAGLERASTPETGDKPERDATDAPVLAARVEKQSRGGAVIYASASRRSRFPSLRELFSGALGRFVPNPQLEPERQDLFEVGAAVQGRCCEASLAVFAGYLDGGIEKVSLANEERQFQRRNVDEIRTLGLELMAGWRPWDPVRVQVNHTIRNVRRLEDGSYQLPAEDRPDYLSSLSIHWDPLGGLHLRLEAIMAGPRHSADATDSADGLRRLPAQGHWNARVAYTWLSPPAGLGDVELFVRADNLFDQVVYSQVGLPEAGRMVRGGVKLGIGP